MLTILVVTSLGVLLRNLIGPMNSPEDIDRFKKRMIPLFKAL
ncbi:hypothetical protein TRICHSKD4_2514 [Roseibium sp. TrichSKD4]|nr:hypothetical protein TRICHSKD4_2514 [Roseibium sp. TrichSKD4]